MSLFKEYRVGLITYDVPHIKTRELFFRLRRRGVRIGAFFACEFKQRKNREVLFQHRPSALGGISLNALSRSYDIPVVPLDKVLEYRGQLDFLMVGGCGLLPQSLVSEFKVLNCHPGLIPLCRGLDSFKWAILKGKPIGNTLHIIDDQVDMGTILHHEPTPLFLDDTIDSFALRHYEAEIDLLSNFQHYLDSGKKLTLEQSDPTMRMPIELEKKMLETFEEYKSRFGLDRGKGNPISNS